MRHILRNNIIVKALRKSIGAALLAPMFLTMTSCDSLIYEDLEPCDSGVILRFVYDYNMEFANSFHSQVDDLTVLLYDIDGKYIDTYQFSKDEISDEDFRLKLDLPLGTYHIAAYGGINKGKAPFVFDEAPEEVPMRDRRLRLVPRSRGSECDEYLAPLYYGAQIVVVPTPSPEGHVQATIRMLKNTNDFKIALQQLNGNPLDSEDFEYQFVDDNILFDCDNKLMPTGGITYRPWVQGVHTVGSTAEGSPWVTAYAELSTSRLIDRSASYLPETRSISGLLPGVSSVKEPRLEIRNSRTSKVVLSIPIIRYLELYKSTVYEDMPLQEFLDRQNRWDIIFFLDESQNWISSYIQVNDWVVRVNDIDV